MTPSCSDCVFIRFRAVGPRGHDETCGVSRRPRPTCVDQRAEDGPCGPEGKLFAKREEVA